MNFFTGIFQGYWPQISEHAFPRITPSGCFWFWYNMWLSEWVSESVSEWVSEWLSEWVSEWVSDWLIEWVSEWVIDWVSEWVREGGREGGSEWVSEWVSEWGSECVSEWVGYAFIRIVVIGISTNFKWWNSGGVEDVTIRGSSLLGVPVFQGSIRTL